MSAFPTAEEEEEEEEEEEQEEEFTPSTHLFPRGLLQLMRELQEGHGTT